MWCHATHRDRHAAFVLNLSSVVLGNALQWYGGLEGLRDGTHRLGGGQVCARLCGESFLQATGQPARALLSQSEGRLKHVALVLAASQAHAEAPVSGGFKG